MTNLKMLCASAIALLPVAAVYAGGQENPRTGSVLRHRNPRSENDPIQTAGLWCATSPKSNTTCIAPTRDELVKELDEFFKRAGKNYQTGEEYVGAFLKLYPRFVSETREESLERQCELWGIWDGDLKKKIKAFLRATYPHLTAGS